MPDPENLVYALMGLSVFSGITLGIMHRRMREWRWRIYIIALCIVGILINLGCMHEGAASQSDSWLISNSLNRWIWIPIGIVIFITTMVLAPRKTTGSDKIQ
jgi:hypothetical protein